MINISNSILLYKNIINSKDFLDIVSWSSKNNIDLTNINKKLNNLSDISSKYVKGMIMKNTYFRLELDNENIEIDMSDPKNIIINKQIIIIILIYILYLFDKHILQLLHIYYNKNNDVIKILEDNGYKYHYNNISTKVNKIIDALVYTYKNEKIQI